MKNIIRKMPYLSDSEIYSLWKYLNGFRFVKRSGVLNFDDLTALNENRLFIAKFFDLLKELKIEGLKELVFHRDIYLKYYQKGYKELNRRKKNGSLDGFSLKHLEFLEKISTDPNKLYKSDDFGIFDFIFYEGALKCLEFFEFSANIPSKDKEKLSNFINGYIKNFITDNLQKEKQNFYCFTEQKRNLFTELHFLADKYGNSFIFKYPKDLSSSFDHGNEEYLFIHTLVALETLGYFEIENIWIFDMDLAPNEQTENYKVKLILKEKFFNNEKEAMFGVKKKIETKKAVKKNFKFDDTKSLLLFNNMEIKISKTRNSNGHYLLKTIFKDKNKIWEYDEIAEDWTDDYGKDDWSRYYNAGYKVNEKIAKETTIKDFLILTNKTVGINKRYM